MAQKKQHFWCAYPFSGDSDALPVSRDSSSFSIIFDDAEPLKIQTVQVDNDELGLLSKYYPDSNPLRPPWKQIEVDLIVAGVPLVTLRDLTSVQAIRLLDAKRSGSATECYVTLQQMAGIVNRSKRTLRRLYDDRKLPSPSVEGTGGKPSEWPWGDVRPILEAEFGRILPDVFPADQFVR